ncbi:MAG TPA: hypothetical protein VJC15_02420 [Candidatus Paceibacterota bacterium]
MENEEKVEIKKKRKWGWIFLCYGIWASVTNNGHTTFGEAHIFTMFFFLVGIVATPILYYRLRDKIKLFNFIKNEGVRNFVIGFAFMIVAVLLISFLGVFGDNWKALAVRTPLGPQIASNDAILGKQLEAKLKMDLADLQNQSSAYEEDIDEQTATTNVYKKNIIAYRALEKLNDEEYSKVEDTFTRMGTIFKNYSESLSSATSAFVSAYKNVTDAENSVSEAKINYYQALLNNDTNAEIETKRQAVNDAVDNLSAARQAMTQANQNFQKASNDFGI